MAQNIEIFIINLARSKDRRESMKRKIAGIRGFSAIYVDDEKITHPLTPSAREGESDSLLRGESIDLPKQSTIKSNPCEATESRPLRGAKNREQDDETNLPILTADTPPQTPPARGGADFDFPSLAIGKTQTSPSLAEGARGWVESSLRDNLSLKDNAPTLHFHFFPATDANDFKTNPANIPAHYRSNLTRFVKGKDLSFGEIACFSSHYRLWEKCIALDSPIVVLEDDIDFMQDFCQITEITKSPFEYVRLYYLFDRKISQIYDNFYISFGRIAGTQGYYLTPTAAQKFIKNARFWLFCVDDYMDMFFIHNVKNIIFLPFIIAEDSANATQSTILGRTKPKMNFWRKLTREMSRIYFYVICKWLYFALHCVEIRANFGANRRQNR